MLRQDDFLRGLQRIAHGHRETNLQDRGLAMIIDLIEARLPNLKPVAYENYDLSSGLSGAGIHHVCGDKASIQQVLRLQNAADNVEAFWRPHTINLEKQVAALQVKLEQIRDLAS